MPLDPLRIAQESPDVASFNHALLRALDSEVGLDVAFFKVLGDPGPPATIGIDPGAVTRATAPGVAYERELMPVKQAAFAARQVAVDTRVLGEEGLRRTAYYRDILRPAGGRHTLLAYPTLRGVLYGALVLGRCGGPFGDTQVESMERWLPAIAVARASYGPRAPSDAPLPVPTSLAHRLLPTRPLARLRRSGVELVVRDRGGQRELVASRRGASMVWTRASIAQPHRSGWPYVDLFHVAAALAARRERALFIGCGGGVAPRQFARTYPGIALDVVDIDADVIALARAHFGLDDVAGLALALGDGVSVVRAAQERWDVIIVDAYDGADLATGFASRSFFTALHRALRAGGAAACNVVGSLDGSGPIAAVERAARTAFEDVRLVPVLAPGEALDAQSTRNTVIVMRKDD